MYSTRLSDFREFDKDNLQLQINEKRSDVQRIRIITHHLDGTKGDLIFSTPRLLTFGLQELYDRETQVLIGYQLPLVLWGKNGPTNEEQTFIDTIGCLTDACKEFILEHKQEIEKPELEESDLSRLNPLYYKIEKGEVKKDHAPLLYVRLNTFRTEDGLNIRTLFTDETTGDTIDANDILQRRCLVRGAIKFESIVLSDHGRPRIQLKLFEARVKFLDNGIRSLLVPDKVFQQQQQRQPVKKNKNAVINE